MQKLRLHYAFFLLALDDTSGSLATFVPYREAVSAALMAELLLEQFVEIDASKKGQLIRALKSGPTGDDLMDEALRKIIEARRRKSLKNWILKLRNASDMSNQLAAPLLDSGILYREQRRVAWLIKRNYFPTRDASSERTIMEDLQNAIFGNSSEIDTRTVILLSLCHHTHLLPRLFDRSLLRGQKKRIKIIIDGEMIGAATAAAVQAIQAAMVTAVVIPTVAAARAGS